MSETNTSDDNKRTYDDKGGDDDKPYKRQVKYKKKVCKFCHDKELEKSLDYKRIDIIERFISNRGKIIPRRITGNCAFHQRAVAREIKKARSICLLPFKVM